MCFDHWALISLKPVNYFIIVIEEKKKVVSAEAILTLRHLMLVDVFVL